MLLSEPHPQQPDSLPFRIAHRLATDPSTDTVVSPLPATIRDGALQQCFGVEQGVRLVADVNDVAAYILKRHGPMSTMKLQKLAYYAQAWSLVWDEVPLFDAEIQAWINGPVIYELYRQHRGRFTVDSWKGDPDKLTLAERETVDAVLKAYTRFSGQQLGEMAHREGPWREARGDAAPTDRSNAPISPESMQEYYMAVAADSDAQQL